jgi:hypothetical protein
VSFLKPAGLDLIWLMAAADLGSDVFSLTHSTISFQGYVFISSVRKMIHSANLKARLPKSVMVIQETYFPNYKNS